MNKKYSGKNESILDESLALGDYLDGLLSDTPSTPEPVARLRAVDAESKLSVRPITTETPRILPREIPVAPPPEVKETIVEEPVVAEQLEAAAEEKAAEPESEVPEWGDEPFQSLLFSVAGLKLAVPLARLNGVLNWSDEITPMPGHSEHFMGLLPHLDKNVKIVDTAGIVVPPERMKDGERQYGNIILIGEGEWGLACDDIDEVITLGSDDVRWRTSKGKRAWLAGTVIEQMCALLNTDALAEQLGTGGYQ
ncbi:hypothetical protein BOW53_00775 [Solemya pervernicosa gill symbiont]|uniref:CheW-like domain-containing protein n=2 Tax=Gammaproteobacteria incertae sedis TaxID=118884 RepID=A0A1T2LAS0_9GAMM|nr:chemotaxis protein CheW [Candidatus Reidiella endopervernicosa]OOZ42144.1 hypothetical protein BOW53_00775 [Solemya pervernicosa gill symbiont]QKQ27293.1 chemotaxis protein CheW [Candidatus Reidiella endopervernicosa]